MAICGTMSNSKALITAMDSQIPPNTRRTFQAPRLLRILFPSAGHTISRRNYITKGQLETAAPMAAPTAASTVAQPR